MRGKPGAAVDHKGLLNSDDCEYTLVSIPMDEIPYLYACDIGC